MNTNQKLYKSSSDALNDIQFSDLFDLNEIQHLQDLFADTHGVASVITFPDGIPITNPSNFCRLCNDIIRKSGKGRENCFKSDAAIGKQNSSGSIVQLCLSGGLWDAGASITVGGKHIANWLMGQVRNEEVDELQMIQYADEIGINRAEFMEAFNEVPVMSVGQFNKVAKLLFAFANELSEKAYNNWQLKIQMAEREKLLEMYQESEARYKSVLEASPDDITITDIQGRILMISPSAFTMFGYDPDTVFLGRSIIDFIVPEDKERASSNILLMLQGNRTGPNEYHGVHADGSIFDIEVNSGFIRDTEGQPSQMVFIVRDITGRKPAEVVLRESRQIREAIINTIPVRVFWKDKNLKYLGCNTQFALDAGFEKPEDIIGKDDYTMGWSKQAELYRADDLLVIGSGIPKLFIEEPQTTSSGEQIYLLTSKVPLKDTTGEILGVLGTYLDITDRKLAEDALRESESQLSETQSVAKVGSWTTDLTNLKVKWSKEIYRIFEIDPDSFHSSHQAFLEFVHPEDREKVDAAFVLSFDSHSVNTIEHRILTPSGKIKFVEEYWKIIGDHQGKPVRAVGSCQDITERKRADEMLRESEARLNLALKFAGMSVWHWDIIEDRRYFDDQVCYLLGINPATFTGTAEEFFLAVHPDDRQTIKVALARTIEKDVLYEPEYRVVWPDKSIHYVTARGRLSRDDKGRPASINGIIWDVTESKQKDEVLLKLKKAVDNSSEIIFLTDIEGIFTFVNPAFTSVYGFSVDEIIGKVTPRILKSGLMEVNDNNLFWETLLSGKEVRGELINKRKDGTSIYIESTVNPIFDEMNNIIGFLGIQRDISERKQAEQELIEAKERAEESDELKTAFLNNISHEIRTPFNGILGFLSIIQDSDLTSSERDEYIDLTNKSAYRLMNTINDIVEISQIQAGQMKMTASETNIKSLTGELFDHFITDAESQGLEFTINNELPDSLDCIFTDRIKLKTVLSILIGNAIKFTKVGSVELGIHKKGGYLEFSVKDTGIGISENKKQVIFERFMQGDVSNTRQFEGSGLGLSISTAYADMLGGKIWVESEEGKGSVFYFTIPYNVEPEEKNVVKNVVSAEGAANEINPKISGLKILIVEDDQASAKFVTLIVRVFSKEVLLVSNGLDAVKACRDNPDIDLVLMDIQMPEMNGYEATMQIRQFNNEVIIIAQTAFGLTGDREKAMDAGCNDYISKPIKKGELLSVIRKHIEL
jgi:hypothetical protein